MKRFLLFCSFFVALGMTACGGDDELPMPPKPETPETPQEPQEPQQPGNQEPEATTDFVRGADISWYTEMKADGKKFYSAEGTAMECPELMRSIGMNAIRLRVWVNPERKGVGAYSNAEDVLAKAKACHAAGLNLMIDFHFSDWWADPSRQDMPLDWQGLTQEELRTKVADHVRSVLSAIKQAGVPVAWVQVGNETRNGMLHPTGQLWDNNGGGNLPDGWKHFTALYMAGYNAAKAVCPTALVMPHLNTASKVADNNWWLDEFRKAGGKMDALALSHYPQADGTATTPEAVNKQALLYIKQAAKAYGVPVVVSEFGVKTQADVTTATRLASDFMAGCKEMGTDVCAGVFYWEPEVWGQWRPASYTSYFDNWSAYDMGAFNAAGRPTSVLNSWAQ